MSPRLRKDAKLLTTPAGWPALAQGVAATLEHDAALGQEPFNTVIDVGANKGQFATDARLRWPNASLISCEPLPAQHPGASCVTRSPSTQSRWVSARTRGKPARASWRSIHSLNCTRNSTRNSMGSPDRDTTAWLQPLREAGHTIQ